MSFDYIIFLLFGTYSLIMGILNRGNALWWSLYDDSKKSLGKNYARFWNLFMGIISILIGIALYNKNQL